MLKIISPTFAASIVTLISLGLLTTAPAAFAQKAAEASTKAAEKAASQAPPQEGLRPEIAKPLQAAQAMLNMKQFTEAMAKIIETDLVANRTPFEAFIIERMRGTAAAALGDNAVSAKSFEAVMATNRLTPAERILFSEAITAAYYNLKDYKTAAVWAGRSIKEGSTQPQIRMLQIQSLFLADDIGAARAETNIWLEANEKAGVISTEDLLKMSGRIALKQKDSASYLTALQKLVSHYPNKNYWADWVARVAVSANMTDRYMKDVFRLQLALGDNLTQSQYMFLARTAMEAGFPIDAKQILDHGFDAKVLGVSAEQKTLRDKATKEAADDIKNMPRTSAEAALLKTGPALFNSGLNYAISGDKPKGIAMMEEGIKRLSAKPLEDAKLRLGINYALAGEGEKAINMLTPLRGQDGLTEVAMLWATYAKQLKKAAS